MIGPGDMRTTRPADISVRLVQESDPQIEQSLRDAFAAALAETIPPDSRQVAAYVERLLGRGGIVALEAERGPWSRYRVAMRVQGQPVTIATVEITLPV